MTDRLTSVLTFGAPTVPHLACDTQFVHRWEFLGIVLGLNTDTNHPPDTELRNATARFLSNNVSANYLVSSIVEGEGGLGFV